MLLYRFDNLAEFPLLESETTMGARVRLAVEDRGPNAHLRLLVESAANGGTAIGTARTPDEPRADELVVALGLPFRSVAGRPETFRLETRGDAGGCRVVAEASDALGWGFGYDFGHIDATGLHICAVDAQNPREFWAERKQGYTVRIVPPVQLHRLKITLNASCRALNVGLHTLSVSGNVWLSAPGLAGTEHA
jgi:hypothetical protein